MHIEQLRIESQRKAHTDSLKGDIRDAKLLQATLVVKAPWAKMLLRQETQIEIRPVPLKQYIGQRIGISESDTGRIQGSLVFGRCEKISWETFMSPTYAKETRDLRR